MVAGVPSPPTNLTVSLSTMEVFFTWTLPESDGGSPITNIEVTIEAGDPVNSTFQSTFGVASSYTAFSFDFRGGWTYSAFVTAINANGRSDPSARVDFTALSVPAGVRDVQVTTGNGFVNLTWMLPDDGGSPILQYNISRTVVGQPIVQNFTVPAWQTYFNDTGVVNGVRYYYDIISVNALGGLWSSGLHYATPGVPSPPLDLRATSIRSGNVTIEWTPPASDGGSPITMYRIYAGGFGDQLVATTSPVVTSYNNSSLSDGIRCFFAVSAVNLYGESELSSWVDIQVPPSPPQNLTADVGRDFVNLTWDAPASNPGEIWEYDIVRQGGNEEYPTMIGTTYDRYYNDTNEGDRNGPTTGVSYLYNITARNYQTESEACSLANVTVGTLPGAPSELCISIDGATVRLNWTTPSDNGGCDMLRYVVYRGESPDSMTYLANVTGHVTCFNDTTAVPGRTVYYKVVAVNPIGAGDQSNAVDAVLAATSEGADMSLWLSVLGLVAAVALAVLVLISRRRKP